MRRSLPTTDDNHPSDTSSRGSASSSSDEDAFVVRRDGHYVLVFQPQFEGGFILYMELYRDPTFRQSDPLAEQTIQNIERIAGSGDFECGHMLSIVNGEIRDVDDYQRRMAFRFPCTQTVYNEHGGLVNAPLLENYFHHS